MREIKFRAWNFYNKMMDVMWIGSESLGYPMSERSAVKCFYDEEHGSYSTWGGYIDERRTKDRGRSACVIMQYTGIKDMFGKEIYEGDVVEMGLVKYVVKFCEGSFRLCESKYPSGFLIGDCSSKMYEVIGNIYDNPDFIK